MAYPRVGKRFLVLPSNTVMATQANSASSGGAFPYLTIDLDASAGPLSFLTLTDRTRAEAVSRGFLQATRAPPLWRKFDAYDINKAIATEPIVDDTLFFRALVWRRGGGRPRGSLSASMEFFCPCYARPV